LALARDDVEALQPSRDSCYGPDVGKGAARRKRKVASGAAPETTQTSAFVSPLDVAPEGARLRMETTAQSTPVFKSRPDDPTRVVRSLSPSPWLGLAIRRRRESHGLSPEALAVRVDLHRTYISLIERTSRNISVEVLTDIADALGLRPSQLLQQAEQLSDAKSG
jgi:ribosome-binding protein aMBF1 (putative translation factor)